jgi:transcription elongation factor Elf1
VLNLNSNTNLFKITVTCNNCGSNNVYFTRGEINKEAIMVICKNCNLYDFVPREDNKLA